MSEYYKFKERFEELQDTDFSDNSDERISELTDLAEDMLSTLETVHHFWYLSERRVPYKISSYYPRITKDPTVNCFKDNHLVGTQTLDNPDFTKLHELGLYVLSEGEGGYYIRTVEQLSYISKFLEGELKQVMGLEGYHYEINFD